MYSLFNFLCSSTEILQMQIVYNLLGDRIGFWLLYILLLNLILLDGFKICQVKSFYFVFSIPSKSKLDMFIQLSYSKKI